VTDHDNTLPPRPYGMLAQFDNGDDLAAAAGAARAAGYTRLDGFSPVPVAEVGDALGFPKSEMGPIMFLGGMFGGMSGFFMQMYTNGYDYPFMVGGRGWWNSWPSFIVVSYELTILSTALCGLFGMIALCGLPHFHHPLFAVPSFARASRDRFFLCVEAADPKYDPAGTKAFLEGLAKKPLTVEEVPS
jgi:hypothetical protein